MNVKRTEKRGARMGIRVAALLSWGLAVAILLTGCSEEVVSTAPTAEDLKRDREILANREPKKKNARAAAAAAANDQAIADSDDESAEYAAGGQDYFYDPRNKRDPFRSYRFVGDTGPEENFGPLGDFELGQLELSAVIWDAANPRALILDPGGRSYIVREGSQIGKNSGQVIHIGDNLVLVKETYENFAGERTTKDVELRIRLSQGG